MNIKKIIRICLQLSIAMSLLIANFSSVAAGGGKGGDYVGQVSKSVSATLPTPTAAELEKLGVVMPNATQPLPGGGTATATAGLSWSQIRMDGIARSSLSNTSQIYHICARLTQLFMNSTPQGGNVNPTCDDKTGGGSVQNVKSKTVASVFGKTWRADTAHNFTKSGWGGWHPTLTVSVNL